MFRVAEFIFDDPTHKFWCFINNFVSKLQLKDSKTIPKLCCITYFILKTIGQRRNKLKYKYCKSLYKFLNKEKLTEFKKVTVYHLLKHWNFKNIFFGRIIPSWTHNTQSNRSPLFKMCHRIYLIGNTLYYVVTYICNITFCIGLPIVIIYIISAPHRLNSIEFVFYSLFLFVFIFYISFIIYYLIPFYFKLNLLFVGLTETQINKICFKFCEKEKIDKRIELMQCFTNEIITFEIKVKIINETFGRDIGSVISQFIPKIGYKTLPLDKITKDESTPQISVVNM